MKKIGVLIGLFILVISFSFVGAYTYEEEVTQVDAAYKCLIDNVDTKGCSRMSLEESIFSTLAVNKCADRIDELGASDQSCWPYPSCDLKTTSQALLAYDKVGVPTDTAEAWLLEQQKVPGELLWYLEIDSEAATTCSISYGAEGDALPTEYSVNIGEDKIIDSAAGSCLALSEGGYWLGIAPTCYGLEYEISCNEGFITTLLFRKQTSSTVHVLKDSHSASADGTTLEKINSLCFAKNGKCDYEGSLWASMVLDYKGYDISAYIPYLINDQSVNQNLFPEMFLYMVTNSRDYKTDLMQEQFGEKYWEGTYGRYFDTALALYPFYGEEFTEKTNSKTWLLDVQENNGCWDSENIRNTAFVLHSIWPRNYFDIDSECEQEGFYCMGESSCTGEVLDVECSGAEICCDTSINETDTNRTDFNQTEDDWFCEEAGFFCMSRVSCEGEIFNDYECAGTLKCCDTEKEQETCSNIGGEVCNLNEFCSGGSVESVYGLSYGEKCCANNGECKLKDNKTDEFDCEANFGTCEPYSCEEGYEEDFGYSCEYGDICCMKTPGTGEGGKTWIWILLVLIILIVGGIVFKDKLKIFWTKISSKKPGRGKKGPGMTRRGPPRMPPSYPRGPPGRMIPPKKIIPKEPIRRPVVPAAKPQIPAQKVGERKSPKELDDVLKKLKEMSK
ncbi:hypothetical protein HOD29_03565 [archaeon]|jgi:hypothetical protein|nr:hypothetical protein [archaeon]